MRLVLFILFLISLPFTAHAWFTPLPSTNQIASTDILASSSDSYSLGLSGNVWQNAYVRNQYFPYRAEKPTNIASFGVVYASTDGSLYFRNAAGTNTKIV